jgi:hypothetical protein
MVEWKNRGKLPRKINPGEKATSNIDFEAGHPGGGGGAVYIVPNPLTAGGELQINSRSKLKKDDGSVSYVVTFTNIGKVATEVDFAVVVLDRMMVS